MIDIFVMNLDEIQPSQLYISSEKLSEVMKKSNPVKLETIEPIPVNKLDDQVIFLDGHTRALAAFLSNLLEVRVSWDDDEWNDLDLEEYKICVGWCKDEGIHTIADLKNKIISPQDYEVLWLKRCEEMHKYVKTKKSTISD